MPSPSNLLLAFKLIKGHYINTVGTSVKSDYVIIDKQRRYSTFAGLLRISFSVLYSLPIRYEMMKNCWKAEPNERPTFEELRDILNNMLNDDEVNKSDRKMWRLIVIQILLALR